MNRSSIATLVLLTLAPLASGCGFHPVRFTREGGNPPFKNTEYSYPGDGFLESGTSDVFRVCLDALRRGFAERFLPLVLGVDSNGFAAGPP